MGKKINRNGQVAIFVILAIIIVAVIAIFFFLRDADTGIPFLFGKETEPEAFMSDCIKESAESTVELMTQQGGLINPDNYIMYNYVKTPYLCYSASSFTGCVAQHPALLSEIKQEFAVNINPIINKCYKQLKSGFEKNGYSVRLDGDLDFEVSLAPGKIILDLNNKIIANKENQQTRTVGKIEIDSPVYELAGIAAEISDQEARYCDFLITTYNLLYPDYKISRAKLSDATKVYTIKDVKTDKEMYIAIRGCVTI